MRPVPIFLASKDASIWTIHYTKGTIRQILSALTPRFVYKKLY